MSLWSAWTLCNAFRDVLTLPRNRAASSKYTNQMIAAQSTTVTHSDGVPRGDTSVCLVDWQSVNVS